MPLESLAIKLRIQWNTDYPSFFGTNIQSAHNDVDGQQNLLNLMKLMK